VFSNLLSIHPSESHLRKHFEKLPV
jgi:hypothetical protein